MRKKTYLKIGATLLTSTLLIRVDQEGFSKGCPNSWREKVVKFGHLALFWTREEGLGSKPSKKIRHRLWMITERKKIFMLVKIAVQIEYEL